MTDLVTWIACTTIILVFLYFCKEEHKLHNTQEMVRRLLGESNTLEALKKSPIAPLAEAYSKSIGIETPEGKKSNLPAEEFVNDYSVCKQSKLNLRMLDTASGTLVGLGLLGTFLGLTLGIRGFDSSNTERINESIQGLLAGMGTAFLTSLLGMSFSIILTAIDKALRNRLYRDIRELTNKLDSAYYIDDMALADLNQQKIFGQMCQSLQEDLRKQTENLQEGLQKQATGLREDLQKQREELQKQTDELREDLQKLTAELLEKLTYNNAEGKTVALGNAIREILTENAKQSKALMSFSTDLAMELNQGFDEMLSRQMQQKLLPLMESVDATTKAMIEHIDQMACTVSAPATDMMQSVVDDLKQSMQAVIKEFSMGLSGSATTELENLATQLGTAAQAMANFPKNMENISATLQVTIEEVKRAIAEISDTSAHANSTAMQQMQEQITLATGAISNAIAEVKEVMRGVSQSSQEQSKQMVDKLANAAEQMGTFLTGTIDTLSGSVKQSVKDITDDISNKQTNMLVLQEDTTTQTRKLLEAFDAGLERLERMNEYVAGTMNGFRQAQGEITVSTSNLRSISSDVKLATELFSKGQNDYVARLAQLQTASQKGLDQVMEMLRDSGELSEEYVQKFEVIKQGLGSIFAQLQNGLTEYSRTVKDTTDKYLASYTSSLTQTTGALASAIERQNEVTEMLTDTISRNKQ